MGAFRWLAHLLARILHGLARTLEGGRADPLDAATAALAQRFPGAPDHWLRYIAARAPHLAAARVDVTPADRAIGDANSPSRRLRWWWSRQNEYREPPLRLAQTPVTVAERHELVTAPGAQEEVTTKRPESSSSATRRARLRIVGGRSASSSGAAKEPSDTGGEARLESRGELRTPPRERVRRPGLRIATITEPTRAELYLDVPPQKSSSQEPQFQERRIREPDTTSFGAPQRDRTASALEFGEQPERTAPEAPAWRAGSPQRPDSGLLLSPHRATAGKTGPIISWGREGRRRTVDHFPSSETARDHWPALLPPEPSDIDNAPVPMPDMARLRDEQDFGAWSG